VCVWGGVWVGWCVRKTQLTPTPPATGGPPWVFSPPPPSPPSLTHKLTCLCVSACFCACVCDTKTNTVSRLFSSTFKWHFDIDERCKMPRQELPFSFRNGALTWTKELKCHVKNFCFHWEMALRYQWIKGPREGFAFHSEIALEY